MSPSAGNSSHANNSSSSSNGGLHADHQPSSASSSLSAFIQHGVAGGGIASICVLDTNTLLRATNLLDALFRHLLQASHHSFLYCTPPPPFTILIPHQVLQELDGLKLNTSSSNVGSQARAASRWLLSSVQASARSNTDEMEYSSITLPPERRPMIIQTASQAQEYTEAETVDETIVNLCASLEKSTRIPVLFCSNDVIARTRAESQGVQTFDLEAILTFAERRTEQILKSAQDSDPDANKSMHDPSRGRSTSSTVSHQARNHAQESALRDAASTLLEQWAEQILIFSTSTTSNVTIHPTTSRAAAPHHHDSMPLDEDPSTHDHDTHSPDLNPHVDWQELLASSSPQTRNRYLSYYEKRQLEQQYTQQHADSMALDGDNATPSGRKRAPSTPGRTTADSVWAR